MSGIEEGADRTAEIVRSLRTFSRLDESEMKKVDIHECIDSTLVILRNATPPYVKVVRDFQADGSIECFPGKLNQVFMNIINNAIQAIKLKKQDIGFHETITVSTRDIDGGRIEIRIKDSGIGMTEAIKHKMFEPFFTTKEVGEGTGLGLAIVFKIIKKHHAKIDVESSLGNGAEFVLTLFHSLPKEAQI
jgi:signal transduction histidine kinase